MPVELSGNTPTMPAVAVDCGNGWSVELLGSILTAELSEGTTAGSSACAINSGAKLSASPSADSRKPCNFVSNIPAPCFHFIFHPDLSLGLISVYKQEKLFARINVNNIKD
jgi:hypothetical protein